jgi:hypothetical protein
MERKDLGSEHRTIVLVKMRRVSARSAGIAIQQVSELHLRCGVFARFRVSKKGIECGR